MGCRVLKFKASQFGVLGAYGEALVIVWWSAASHLRVSKRGVCALVCPHELVCFVSPIGIPPSDLACMEDASSLRGSHHLLTVC